MEKMKQAIDCAVNTVYTFDNSKVYGINCDKCSGTGKFHTEHERCNCGNESLWAHHCPAWIDCPDCDGAGFIEHDPDGSGVS